MSGVALDVDVPVSTFPATERVSRTQASPDDVIVGAFARYHAEIYAYLARSVRDVDEAEDLLQEAFVRLTRETRAGRYPDQVRAWLYRVAANLVISRSRRRGTVARFLDRFGPSETNAWAVEAPEARAILRERRTDLEQALGHLSADARLGLLLSAQGFSGAEIAAALGRSDAATRTLLCRARIRVREILGEEP